MAQEQFDVAQVRQTIADAQQLIDALSGISARFQQLQDDLVHRIEQYRNNPAALQAANDDLASRIAPDASRFAANASSSFDSQSFAQEGVLPSGFAQGNSSQFTQMGVQVASVQAASPASSTSSPSYQPAHSASAYPASTYSASTFPASAEHQSAQFHTASYQDPYQSGASAAMSRATAVGSDEWASDSRFPDQSLFFLVRGEQLRNEAKKLKLYEDTLKRNVGEASRCVHRIRWFFTSSEKKLSAQKAYADLVVQLQPDYPERHTADAVISQAQALFSTSAGDAWQDLAADNQTYLQAIQRAVPSDQLNVPALPVVQAAIEPLAKLRLIVTDANRRVQEVQQNVITSVQSLKQQLAQKTLGDTPITELRPSLPQGVRLGALKNAGYSSVLDICRASAPSIASVHGITMSTALQILHAADDYATTVIADSPVKISRDHKTPESTQILCAVQLYLKYKGAADTLARIQRLETQLKPALDLVVQLGNGFLLPQLTESTKNDIAKALQTVKNAGEGEYAALVGQLIALMPRDVPADAAFADPQSAWSDFERDSIAYFTAIEDLCPEAWGITAKSSMPEALSHAIDEQMLNTTGMTCELRRYQKWGVKYILHQKRVLLGDQMGLGKTVEAIAAMVSLSKVGATHFIVVCPASVLINWEREVSSKSALTAYIVHGSGLDAALNEWVCTGGVAITTYGVCDRLLSVCEDPAEDGTSADAAAMRTAAHPTVATQAATMQAVAAGENTPGEEVRRTIAQNCAVGAIGTVGAAGVAGTVGTVGTVGTAGHDASRVRNANDGIVSAGYGAAMPSPASSAYPVSSASSEGSVSSTVSASPASPASSAYSAPVARVHVDMLVVDEAHYVKNPFAKRTKRVAALANRTDRVLFMTGTPLENRVEEMANIITMLRPDIASRLSLIRAGGNAPQFRAAVCEVYLRRKRDEVLSQLPDKQESVEWCSLGLKENALYEQTVMDGNWQQMRQLSWNVDDLEDSCKACRLDELIADATEDGRKIIVYSFYRHTLNAICERYADRIIGPLNGSVSPAERQRMVDEFNAAPAGTILAAQVQAGGTGLNIQSASVIVFCEPQIKPSIEDQAISRCYRMGQTRNVLVFRLLCAGTVDECILKMLERKRDIFNTYADRSLAADKMHELDGLDEHACKEIIEAEIARITRERDARGKSLLVNSL